MPWIFYCLKHLISIETFCSFGKSIYEININLRRKSGIEGIRIRHNIMDRYEILRGYIQCAKYNDIHRQIM